MTVIDLPRNTERLETLHQMMLRFPEAQAQAKGDGGRGGQFSSAILVFDASTYGDALKGWSPYRELDRCLTELRRLAVTRGPMIARNVTAGQAWWNLSHRYLLCQVVRRDIYTERRHIKYENTWRRVPKNLPANMEIVSRGHILQGEKASVIVRVWDSRVEPEKVQAAVEWVSREFRGEPAIPREMVA